jgi:phage regulator Rha-like protein
LERKNIKEIDYQHSLLEKTLTTSLKVAEAFEKRHDHVVRDIETLIKYIKKPPSSKI